MGGEREDGKVGREGGRGEKGGGQGEEGEWECDYHCQSHTWRG